MTGAEAAREGRGAGFAHPKVERLLARTMGSCRALPLGASLILVTVAVFALFSGLIAPYDPVKSDLGKALIVPSWQQGGSAAHILGTDSVGRDILSRIIHGARVSAIISLSAVLAGGTVGVTVGLVSGYAEGRVGSVLMRLTDITMALPSILIAIIIAATVGAGLTNLIIILAISQWPHYARVVRGEVLTIKQRDFVALATVAGCRPLRVIWHHIFPNVLNTVIVLATLNVATAIVFEAALSFLGLGVQPPTPAWGLMLAEGRKYVTTAWWIVTFPGVAIMITVLGVNLFGDWLRDRLDPRLRQV